MKDFPEKVNISAGDDTGSSTSFGANEFSSLAKENETAVTSTGQTLTTGQAADTKTDQLARALVITGQSASSYTDSGSANSYVLTKSVSGLVQPENYFDGMRVSFTPDNANTGTSTINVSALGSKAIRTVSDANITANVLLTTKIYDLVYVSSFASGAGAFVIDDSIAQINALFSSGTFTPTATPFSGSVTLSVATGSYAKSGKLVTVNAHIKIDTTSASGDYLLIGNLPYSASDLSHGSIRLTLHTAYPTSNMEIAYIASGGTDIFCYAYDGVEGKNQQFPANLLSGTDIYVTISYLTND